MCFLCCKHRITDQLCSGVKTCGASAIEIKMRLPSRLMGLWVYSAIMLETQVFCYYVRNMSAELGERAGITLENKVVFNQ